MQSKNAFKLGFLVFLLSHLNTGYNMYASRAPKNIAIKNGLTIKQQNISNAINNKNGKYD